jgi:hypothetical protein
MIRTTSNLRRIAIALGCSVTFGLVTAVRAEAPPSPQQVQFAEKSSDLMVATLVAALLQEFAETTPDNVAEGKHSISLIFNDRNESMRLVGMLQPLRDNDVPQDPFEVNALDHAMRGETFTAVEKVEGKWAYRRSIPLSNFHAACSMCHTNFGPVDERQWVGALMLRVPVAE